MQNETDTTPFPALSEEALEKLIQVACTLREIALMAEKAQQNPAQNIKPTA